MTSSIECSSKIIIQIIISTSTIWLKINWVTLGRWHSKIVVHHAIILERTNFVGPYRGNTFYLIQGIFYNDNENWGNNTSFFMAACKDKNTKNTHREFCSEFSQGILTVIIDGFLECPNCRSCFPEILASRSILQKWKIKKRLLQ